MHLISRTAARLAFVIPALFFGAQVSATTVLPTISGSIQGSIFSCDDPNDNQPVNVNFTFGGGTVGADTNFAVSLDIGGSAQTLNIPVPTADVEALVQQIQSSGGSLSVSIPSTPLGNGCLFEATLTFTSVGGGSAINPEVTAGNAITTQSELDTYARGQPAANSNRIRSVLRGASRSLQARNNSFMLSGMSAAEGSSMPVGAWFGYTYADTENDFVTTAFTSARHNFTVGVDTMPADYWLLGVSMGLERSRIKTRFNNGEQDVTSITLAPYVGVLLTDWLTLDITAGIGDVTNDQFRFAGATRITSDVQSVRAFANGNVAATYSINALRLTGQGGLLWATQRDEKFLESNGVTTQDARSNVGRFLLGAEIAYSVGAWEPYVSGLFEHDFTRTKQQFAAGVLAPQNDDSDLLLGFGLRYFGNSGVTGSIEYSKLLGRRNLSEDTVSANVRWMF